MKKINVILPMRAGSQRVIDKNIRIIKGKPLYEYILNTLFSSELVDKIIINTDIQQVIDKYKDNPKIIVIEREEHLKGNCNMNSVIEDTINKIEGDYFMQVHATNPLLSLESIEKGIKKYFDNLNSNDSVFSVTKMQKRFWSIDGKPINHDPKAAPTTQDLEPWYEENSCFYIFSRDSFMKTKNRIGEKPLLVETRLTESVDIDEEDELKLVESLI
ncbi:acylneuraminate cytidylyltransferase family protein [Candidatus Woesearchaeota archaeon]|nr:acylneuraminate cytidylyltransferase family protein [Candidatus Woesearchaeota archaeon]